MIEHEGKFYRKLDPIVPPGRVTPERSREGDLRKGLFDRWGAILTDGVGLYACGCDICPDIYREIRPSYKAGYRWADRGEAAKDFLLSTQEVEARSAIFQDSSALEKEDAPHPYPDRGAVMPWPEDPRLGWVGSEGGDASAPSGDLEDADPVKKPAHYQFTIEPIDAIFAWGLNYARGSVVKYLVRAGRKDPTKEIEDLQKAREFLDREIKRLEGQKDKGTL